MSIPVIPDNDNPGNGGGGPAKPKDGFPPSVDYIGKALPWVVVALVVVLALVIIF